MVHEVPDTVNNKILTFELNSAPFSINEAYYKRSFTRTKECRAWGAAIHRQIAAPEIVKLFTEFRQGLPRKLALRVTLEFKYPRDILFTKKGEISLRSKDLSNIEKMLIDLIFDSRFDGRQLDDGTVIHTLSLNDKCITELVSKKMIHPDGEHRIAVTIEQVDMPDVP